MNEKKIELLQQAKGILNEVITLCGEVVEPPIDPPIEPPTEQILRVEQNDVDKDGHLVFKVSSKNNRSVVPDQRSGGHRAWSHSGDWLLLKHLDLETSRADIITLNTKTLNQYKIASWVATGAELCWAYSSDHIWMHDVRSGQKLYKMTPKGEIVKTIDLPEFIDPPVGSDQGQIKTFWQTGYFGAQKTQFLYTVARDKELWNGCYQWFDGDTGELKDRWWHRDITGFASLKDPFPLDTDALLCTYREAPHDYTRISIDGRESKLLLPPGVPWSHAMGQPEGRNLIVTVRGDMVVYDTVTGREVQRVTQQQLKAAITPNLSAPHNWVSSIYYAPTNDICHVLIKTGTDTTIPLPTKILEYDFNNNSFRLIKDGFNSILDWSAFHTTPSTSIHKGGRNYSWKYLEAMGKQVCTYFVRR